MVSINRKEKLVLEMVKIGQIPLQLTSPRFNNTDKIDTYLDSLKKKGLIQNKFKDEDWTLTTEGHLYFDQSWFMRLPVANRIIAIGVTVIVTVVGGILLQMVTKLLDLDVR